MMKMTLYRPTGANELELIIDSGMKRFPPRLYWQPIFYPVLNLKYAAEIAEHWNMRDVESDGVGFVTAFDIPDEYFKKFPVQTVGLDHHQELWIPAEQLEEFNDMIIGGIRVEKAFVGKKFNLTAKIAQVLPDICVTTPSPVNGPGKFCHELKNNLFEMIPLLIIEKLKECLFSDKLIVFLVGAGVSAESGIPTFRGKDGFWVSGSKNYTAQEIGTLRMFRLASMEVWKWYLYRKSLTEKAKPNAGHMALKDIEDILGNQFALISQNVDSLHRKAGNSEGRTHLIHGDLDFVRCSGNCSDELYPFPQGIALENRQKEIITHEEWELLKCPKCGEELRPHVLWFDESYNEKFYKLSTVQKISWKTGILFILGTSGATNLPQMIAEDVLAGNGLVVDVNIDTGYFTERLKDEENGIVVKASSSEFLEELENEIRKLITK
jgi:NAD-dependent deacetylase